MARLVVENPPPYRGRIVHGMDGVARRRCRVCGCTVYGRNCGICRDCLNHVNATASAREGGTR